MTMPFRVFQTINGSLLFFSLFYLSEYISTVSLLSIFSLILRIFFLTFSYHLRANLYSYSLLLIFPLYISYYIYSLRFLMYLSSSYTSKYFPFCHLPSESQRFSGTPFHFGMFITMISALPFLYFTFFFFTSIAYSLTMKMEEEISSETLVSLYEST
jgi:hypothetical protein